MQVAIIYSPYTIYIYAVQTVHCARRGIDLVLKANDFLIVVCFIYGVSPFCIYVNNVCPHAGDILLLVKGCSVCCYELHTIISFSLASHPVTMGPEEINIAL